MNITGSRKQTPCYWEKQPGGCQKTYCPFLHEKQGHNEVTITVKEDVTEQAEEELSGFLNLKKRRVEEQQAVEIQAPDKSQAECVTARTGPKNTHVRGEVRVKTLEEIRREKASRLQAQHNTEDGEQTGAMKRRFMRVIRQSTDVSFSSSTHDELSLDELVKEFTCSDLDEGEDACKPLQQVLQELIELCNSC
ncbi:hypothetical protein JOB18_046475 [Solea senegalensis]|uniref:Zinc-finger CCCH domain-containing protein n=1 Tax=Solea senegalensis TaxID=28829 RepID=A0AAV6PZ94_SOLSE|nr:hypothetical protein JOB18_046475 [Solea senegalensis]